MQTYIALLRGINVGGKNLLPMKDLKVLLEDLGCCDIKTYIQSGNVVFKRGDINGLGLSAAIERLFGFGPKVLVFTEPEFRVIAEKSPYRNVDGKTSHFYFCEQKPILDSEKIKRYQAASEEYRLENNTFYLHAPDGIGRSKLVANIESCIGVSATGRNLNTVNKLLALAS